MNITPIYGAKPCFEPKLVGGVFGSLPSGYSRGPCLHGLTVVQACWFHARFRPNIIRRNAVVTALTQTATLFGGLPVEDSETECEPASDEGSRAINIGRTLRVDPIVHQILFYVRGARVCVGNGIGIYVCAFSSTCMGFLLNSVLGFCLQRPVDSFTKLADQICD